MPVATDRARRQIHRLVGANTVHRFTNKDLTDASNNLGAQATTPFTVSPDSRFRGRFHTIQAAIDAAAAAGGPRTVSLAPGNYIESPTLARGVDLVGSGAAASIILGTLTFAAAGAVSVRDLGINSPGAAFTHTGGDLTFTNCTIAAAAVSTVNGAASTLTLSECTIDAPADILVIVLAASATITRSTIGAGAAGRRFLTNCGATITHSLVRCRLVAAGGACYAAFTRFSGADEPRVELAGGTFEAYHCTFESPGSESPAIVGTGNMTGDFNAFSGRVWTGALVNVRRQDEQETSGSYIPAVTGVNVAAADATGIYSRVGNIVRVSVSLVITSVGGTGAFEFDVSLPLHTTFTGIADAVGSILWGGGNIHLNAHTRAKTGGHIRARVGSALVTIGNIRNPNGTATYSGVFDYVLR